jgi:hypothetical protein
MNLTNRNKGNYSHKLMSQNNTYVLLHSPLVGGLTWTLVADQLRERGQAVIVPQLKDSPDSKEPFWKQHAESVTQDLISLPKNQAVTLVAHSGAGPLLPAIREAIPNPVNAYVFVDAGIPRPNASRLDLMKSEDAEWAEQFEATLQQGERFPNWSVEDLHEIIPDENLRQQLVAELRPRTLNFFAEPIPVFDTWPDAPCIYILLSPPYTNVELQARQAGWATYTLEAGHFHMLVDPKAVTDLILQAISQTME